MAVPDNTTIEQAVQSKKALELPEGTEIRPVGAKFVAIIWRGRSSCLQSGELATREAAADWITTNL